MYGAYRAAEPGYLYWRVAQFLFPFYTHIPTGILGREIRTRCWVPMDDHHTMYFMLSKRPAPSADGTAPSAPVRSAFRENTTDWFGRALYEANGRNDYLIDRESQRARRSFTGLETIHLQDQAVTESMGPVLNRSLEHLGSADVMVIRVRMRLLEAALAFRDKGVIPPGVENPEIYQVRSGGAFLPEGQDWLEGIADLLPAYVEHPELDPRLDARGLRRIR
jgi:phage FluMu protein gp41